MQNALEMARLGRGNQPARTPYTVMCGDRRGVLRRYAAQPGRPRVDHPVLLVPSLVVSADLFDLAPETSAVQLLTRQGIDTWLCDFGRNESGDARTHDDYVRAVDESIEAIRELTGREPHLVGHSQGGMLCYQVAALRRGEGIKSLITLGAPVDLHQTTALDPDLFGRGLQLLRSGTLRSLRKLDALPSTAVDLAFRLVSIDRALRSRSRVANGERTEPLLDDDMAARRSVIGQRSFSAWSGPALSTFTDELVLSNRLLSGGFLVNGKVCSLSDLSLPILYFVAERDDLARPAAVRAIHRAAPQVPELYEVAVGTGHVGLILGRRAFETTWPTLVAWLRWREGGGPKPAALVGQERKSGVGQALHELTYGLELVRDDSTSLARSVARSVQSATRESLKLSESLRLSVARLAKLEQLTPTTRINFGLILSEYAAKNPDGPWFLYDGRGQSYRAANQRVESVVRGLIACGVRPGQHVGVLMNNRPSYLSLVTALSRLGAVAVLLSPHSARASLEQALALAPIEWLVTDPENVTDARAHYPGKLLLLGAPKAPRPALQNVIDMESIDPEQIALPEWYRENPGLADELAMILFVAGPDDKPCAARITNRKWATAAYSAAAFTALSVKDTVYACTPLHHTSSMLVAVGGALVGGARLALAPRFRAESFWAEVRRYGVSVVFYGGDMLRELLHAPSYRGEQYNPIRLFVGSGMRADTERRLLTRFAEAHVLEYYAAVQGSGLLANTSAGKIGAFGKPPEGSGRLLVAAYDFARDQLVRDARGMCLEAGDDEPGLLLSCIEERKSREKGDTDNLHDTLPAIRDVQHRGDRWYFTGEVMRRDPQGNYWPLDRVRDVIHTPLGLAFTRPIEDVLYEIPDVRVAAVAACGEARGKQHPEAWLVMYRQREPDADLLTRLLVQHLAPNERPRRIHLVAEVPMSDGHRPVKQRLAGRPAPGQGADDAQAVYRYDEARARYMRGPA
ncbi:MAG TPA: alpha/beta fold hydrolase [Polyangiales bacterium]